MEYRTKEEWLELKREYEELGEKALKEKNYDLVNYYFEAATRFEKAAENAPM